MTLDIRGSLKNTRISKNPLVVVDELLANSIDAYLIRRSTEANPPPFSAKLRVSGTPADLLGESYDIIIECEDNGCGLGPEQLKAFLTKDTSYKDDLSIPGIGQCKGTGRVQFFHHFTELAISSVYRAVGGVHHVYLPPISDRKAIEPEDFEIEERTSGEVGTKITLAKVEPKLRDTLFSAVSVQRLFNAGAIKQHVLFNLLQRFVSLTEELDGFSIEFSSDLDGGKSQETLQPKDIPEHTTVEPITVEHVEGDNSVSAEFNVTHYKLNALEYPLPQNLVGLCAKASIADVITARYLKC